MKTLFLTAVTLLSLSANAAQFTCGSTSAKHKRTYPINAAAIKAVALLGLKTCSGTSSDRFKTYVEKNKHTVKFITVTKAELNKAKNDLIKIGGSVGPKL